MARTKSSVAKSVYAVSRLAQGATIQQIASELGITDNAVRVRINNEIKEQMQQMGNIVARLKIMQTEQLNHIYIQAIKSWNLSAAVVDGEPTQEGNSKYLDTAMKSLKDIRDIWDVEQPLDITDNGDVAVPAGSAQPLDANKVNEVLVVLQQIGALPESIDTDSLQSELLPEEVIPDPPIEFHQSDDSEIIEGRLVDDE